LLLPTPKKATSPSANGKWQHTLLTWDSLVGVMTHCRAAIQFPTEMKDFFLYSIASRPVLASIEPSVQWVFLPGVNRPVLEVNCSPPSTANTNNGGVIHLLPHVFMAFRI
jgi:hypothetical protein